MAGSWPLRHSAVLFASAATGWVIGVRQAGLTVIIPFVDVLHRVSLRIVTMPIQSQGIITRDNGSVDVSAVAAQVITQPDGAAAR